MINDEYDETIYAVINPTFNFVVSHKLEKTLPCVIVIISYTAINNLKRNLLILLIIIYYHDVYVFTKTE